jgi:hypothetical protein
MQKETAMTQAIDNTAEGTRSLSLAEIETVTGARVMGMQLPHLGMTIAVDENCVNIKFDTSPTGGFSSILTCKY